MSSLGLSFEDRKVTSAKQFSALGKIAWLYQMSPLHRDWTISIQARTVLPAVNLGQYRILEVENVPVAYASWAFFDLHTEKKYVLNPNQIDYNKWNSGNRLWFIDYISPFDRKYTSALNEKLQELFSDQVARSIRVKKRSNKAKVKTYFGKSLSIEQASRMGDRLFEDLKTILSEN